MITSEFPPSCGGIGNYVYNISKKLTENGHSVTVLTRGDNTKKIIHESHDGINVYKVRFLPLYPFHVAFHGYFINNFVKNHFNEYDLVHLHSPLIPVIKSNIPKILTEHGTVISGIKYSKMENFESLFLKIFSKIFIRIDDNSVNSANIITTVSSACANEIKKRLDKQNVYVLRNGVDTKYFKPKNEIFCKSNFILYTGRLDSRKGIGDLIESAYYVSKKNKDVKFIITGKGSNKKNLQNKVNQLGLQNQIKFVGYVSKDKLLDYYQNATMYVLPSYYEGLPTTLLEAMSCALPSIATNVEGSSEVITDGINGLLVPPNNPIVLAESILTLLNNEDLRKTLGYQARKHIIDNYEWDIICDRLEKIYIEHMIVKQVDPNYQ